MKEMQKDVVTLVDRLGVALLSAVSALITGTFIWVLVFFSLARISDFQDYQPTFLPVLIFTALMALLGFLTKLNLVANIFGAIWRFLYKSKDTWQ